MKTLWRGKKKKKSCIDLQIGVPVSTVTRALGVWTRMVWSPCWLEALSASPTACWESSTTGTTFTLTPLRCTGELLLAVIFKSQLQFYLSDVLSCFCRAVACQVMLYMEERLLTPLHLHWLSVFHRNQKSSAFVGACPGFWNVAPLMHVTMWWSSWFSIPV